MLVRRFLLVLAMACLEWLRFLEGHTDRVLWEGHTKPHLAQMAAANAVGSSVTILYKRLDGVL